MAFDLETETEFETDIAVDNVDTALEQSVAEQPVEEAGVTEIDEFDEPEFIEEVEENVFDISSVDPETSTDAKPGSDDKVLMLAARYAAGLPLWHNSDCYDHGPGLKNLFDFES